MDSLFNILNTFIQRWLRDKDRFKIEIESSIEYSEEHNINRLKLTLMNKGTETVTVSDVYYKNREQVNLNYHSLPLRIKPGQSDSDRFPITGNILEGSIIIIVKDQISNKWKKKINLEKEVENS